MWVEGYPCRRDGLRHCLWSDRKSIETSDIYLERERERERTKTVCLQFRE